MPRKRPSLRGKGVDIFYPNGEETDEERVEATSPAAIPAEEAAPADAKKRATRRKPRTRKPKTQPPADAAAVEAPPVKTPTTVTAPTPAPVTPVVKTPVPVTPALPSSPPPPRKIPPPPPSVRTTPPPTPPAPAPLAEPPGPAVLTTSARYDRLAAEIDELYTIAARRMAAGRGVGQSMQWLSRARQLVITGKTADFAEAELLVQQISGILKHGDEIDRLYIKVEEEVSENPKLTQKCMDWLHEARQKIMTGKLDDLVEAEFLMEQVKGILARVQKSRAASNSWSTRILWVWLMTWLIVFLTIFILDKPLAGFLHNLGLKSIEGQTLSSVAELILPWLCLVWGGVGSVFDTLIAINEHIAKRTYDGHYVAKGFASPVYGAILGTLVYFLFTGGLVAIGTGVALSSVGGISPESTIPATATTASRSLALWVIAFLAGFFHNRTFDLLEKVFDQILITLKVKPALEEEEEKAPEPPSPPPSPPTEPGVVTPPGPPTTQPPVSLPGPIPSPPSPVTQPPPSGGPPGPPEGPPSPPEIPIGPPEGPPGPPEGPPPGTMDIGNI